MRANEVGVPQGRASMDALVAARRTGGSAARARGLRGVSGRPREVNVKDGVLID